MYTDIEKKLNKITDSLEKELLQAKAIDEKGRAIDVKKFDQIIDEKIAQCNEVLATTEKEGVTTDLYGANIAYARIDRLKKAKKHRMLNPESGWFDHTEDIGIEKAQNTKPEKKKEPEKSVFGVLDDIFTEMNKSLKESEAIDKSGRATDIAKFHQIINKAIDQCNKALDTTERDGYTFDRYGAQMLHKNVDWLKDMKKFDTINPEREDANHIGEIPKVKPSKEPMYKQLSRVTSDLGDVLLESKAIDEKGNVVDIAKFHQIINDKIKQCYALLEIAEPRNEWSNAESDEDDILEAIEWLRRFKVSEHVIFRHKKAKDNVTENKTTRTNAFKSGLAKLFSLFKTKQQQSNKTENNR